MLTARQQPAPPDSEAIAREFNDRLLAFIRRRVESPEVAEDVLQEAMLRIHRNVADLERADAVAAWVHRIARSAIADHYRRMSVRRELPLGGEVHPEATEPGADQQDARAELAECISPLLGQLPPIHREALALCELEGLTQAEAAARVGLSLSGMKSRVQRAREQLKEVLLRCCSVEFDTGGGIAGYRRRDASCGCSDCE